jgi:mono/diheme cytochrome c family protein
MRILSVVLAALTLAACAKGSNGANAAASASAAANNPASASDGATVYLTNCSSCHQSNGQGLANAFPPLAGNPLVTGNPVAVIAIVRNGLEGRVVVHGVAYSGIMPAWKGQISNEQIADVITYIRSAWTNHASGVSLTQVQSMQ